MLFCFINLVLAPRFEKNDETNHMTIYNAACNQKKAARECVTRASSGCYFFYFFFSIGIKTTKSEIIKRLLSSEKARITECVTSVLAILSTFIVSIKGQ